MTTILSRYLTMAWYILTHARGVHQLFLSSRKQLASVNEAIHHCHTNRQSLQKEIDSHLQTLYLQDSSIKEKKRQQQQSLSNTLHHLTPFTDSISQSLEHINTFSKFLNTNHKTAKIYLSALKQLEKLANDIIESRLYSSQEFRIQASNFPLRSFLDSISLETRSRLESSLLHYQSYHPFDDKKILYCDQVRLRQIISNLIDNAIKYTTKGYIRFLSYEAPPYVVFQVHDSGKGVDSSDTSHIFSPFFQKAPSEPGNGLGLFVVSLLVNALGGYIRCQSQPGQGSIFSVFIPDNSNDTH